MNSPILLATGFFLCPLMLFGTSAPEPPDQESPPEQAYVRARLHHDRGRFHETHESPDSALAHYHLALQMLGPPTHFETEGFSLRATVELWNTHRLRATVLQDIGDVLFDSGQIEDALGYYRRAEVRLSGMGTNPRPALERISAVFEVLLEPDSVFFYQGEFLAASPGLQSAGRPADLAREDRDQGRWSSAFINFSRAFDALEHLGKLRFETSSPLERLYFQIGHQHVGSGFQQEIGDLLYDAGLPEAALDYHRRAVALQGEALSLVGGGPNVYLTPPLNSLARTFDQLGMPDSAFTYFQEALAANDQAGGTQHQKGQLLNNLGSVYLDLGRPDSAIAYHRQALDLLYEDSLGSIASALNNLGVAYHNSENLDSAKVHLLRAEGMFIGVGDVRGQISALNNLGLLHQDLGNADSSIVYLHRAVQTSDSAGQSESAGPMLANLGRVYRHGSSPDSALSYYGRALRRFRASEEPQGEAIALRSLGQVYHRTASPPDPEIATAYFDSAATVQASVRLESGGDANRLAFAELQADWHDQWSLAWLGRAQEVGSGTAIKAGLAATERGRAQAMLDLMRETSSAVRPGADLALEADSLLARLRSDHIGALAFLVTEDTLVTWVLSPSGDLSLERRPVAEERLGVLVTAFRDGVGVDQARSRMAGGFDPEPPDSVLLAAGWSGDYALALSELGRILIPEGFTERFGPGTEVLVIPHGLLNLVPFAALPVGPEGAPLGHRNALRFAPSLRMLNLAEARPGLGTGETRAARLREALVLGNPEMPRMEEEGWPVQLESLPEAEEEAKALGAFLGVEPLTGGSANETSVWRRLPGAPLVHLATHGLAYGAEGKVRESFIALTPDPPGNDGFLRAGELIDASDLRLDADLAVLSACQTGLGHQKEAEGTVGLQRAFLVKGARSVLVSLWSVDEKATRHLMETFYRFWLDEDHPVTKAEALRLAQVAVSARWPDPKFWAAFQLVGAR